MNRRQLVTGSAAILASGVLGGAGLSAKSRNFVVPPEEGQHERTFMQWPVNRLVYRDQYFLKLVQNTIADIANAISEFEPVTLLAARDFHRSILTKVSSNVELWDIPTDDLWCRDSGPLFAIRPDGQLVVSHIQFDGWGNKQTHEFDGKIAENISDRLSIPLVASGLKGEAGGVEHDGHGLLMAHESSWVNDNRNPGISRDEIEHHLLAAYGAERMYWSPGVWGEDITDYHIDSLARFTGPGKVVINLPTEPDTEDSFHLAALETHRLLMSAGLEVEVIPEPNYRRVKQPDFVASYANYYVCNGGVVMAQFGDDVTDELAANAMRRHYPNREIVSLNVDALGEIGGGIHCATQQMPAT